MEEEPIVNIISSTTVANTVDSVPPPAATIGIQELPDDALRSVCRYLDLWNLEKVCLQKSSTCTFWLPNNIMTS